jgi:TRAP transporter TAXI family solute receptor
VARRRLVLALVATLLAACGRGPEPARLQAEVQQRLDAQFEAGLFHVASFQRRGSAPFRDLERGESGLFVYYDADLELQRDYDLASWKGLNLGTLAYGVGATPAGVSGFVPQGNLRGDVLRVHGRQAWQELDEGWQPIDAQPLEHEERTFQPAEGAGPKTLLRSIRELVAGRPLVRPETRDGAILFELRRAAELIDLRLARMDGALVMGTGEPPGTYHEFGRAFARHASGHGLALHAHPSAGSAENGIGIQSGLLDFGLLQSDVAEALYSGARPFPSLRSVASLWPEVVHVVTLEGSGIRHFSDLRGRRIASGRLGSGTRLNTFELGDAAGLRYSDYESVSEVSLAESIAALESDAVDAIFVTEGTPSRALQDLTRRREDVHFVSVEESALESLSLDHFAYYGLTVPARTYPGQDEPFRALALTAALVTHAETPDDAVQRVLTLLLDGTTELSQTYYRAGFISTETMRLGLAVPLHPAAAAVYMDRERPDEKND